MIDAMRRSHPLLLLLPCLAACPASVTHGVGEPCDNLGQCDPPAVCDVKRDVCVAPDSGWLPNILDFGPARPERGRLRPDMYTADSLRVPDAGCPKGSVPCGGVCAATDKDSKHCGSCFAACKPFQSCQSSKCGCVNGFADCDGNPNNGCESYLVIDDDNCLSCGKRCGANAYCAGGCSCRGGFLNCDGNWSNGCECATSCVGSSCKPPQANWTNCTRDAECQSKWCGCNGETVKQCLPSTSYTKNCQNWSDCVEDADCASKWCGCNGTPLKRCLPNQQYPKYCT
jgi:hypothetical protein